MRNKRIFLRSPEETLEWGRELGKTLPANSVLSLTGDLGAGKTTLIKGIVETIAGCKEEEVSSPTFVYLNIYGKDLKVYHFDLYRLSGPDEFLSMGFDELFQAGGITCLEWGERIETILPDFALRIHISHVGIQEREAFFLAPRGEVL